MLKENIQLIERPSRSSLGSTCFRLGMKSPWHFILMTHLQIKTGQNQNIEGQTIGSLLVKGGRYTSSLASRMQRINELSTLHDTRFLIHENSENDKNRRSLK